MAFIFDFARALRRYTTRPRCEIYIFRTHPRNSLAWLSGRNLPVSIYSGRACRPIVYPSAAYWHSGCARRARSFDALHELQSKSRLRIDLGLRSGRTSHRGRKHNRTRIKCSFCQAKLGRILTRFDGRQPLLARDWRVQSGRLRSSRIPSSPQKH